MLVQPSRANNIAMQWQIALPYTVPLFVAAALTCILTLIVWAHRSTPGAPALLALGSAATLWSLAYALELSTVGSPFALFWARVQYIGIMTLPVAWLVFALHYTNRQHWLNGQTCKKRHGRPLYRPRRPASARFARGER